MDHRICLDPFKLFVVEILQVGGFQVYQLDIALSEIRNDDAVQQNAVQCPGIRGELPETAVLEQCPGGNRRTTRPTDHESSPASFGVTSDFQLCGCVHVENYPSLRNE